MHFGYKCCSSLCSVQDLHLQKRLSPVLTVSAQWEAVVFTPGAVLSRSGWPTAFSNSSNIGSTLLMAAHTSLNERQGRSLQCECGRKAVKFKGGLSPLLPSLIMHFEEQPGNKRNESVQMQLCRAVWNCVKSRNRWHDTRQLSSLLYTSKRSHTFEVEQPSSW